VNLYKVHLDHKACEAATLVFSASVLLLDTLASPRLIAIESSFLLALGAFISSLLFLGYPVANSGFASLS